MVWYDGLAAAVSSDLRALSWDRLLPGRPAPEITSRAKTIDTLRDKLLRDPATPLSSIQDIAGVRFECEMTLEEQDQVAATVARDFDCGPEAIRDLRDGSHAGYRGVHVWLRLPRGRAEVQVRTHLQGEWANTYEALADWLGRQIRYGDLPDDPALADVVKNLQVLSTATGASLEEVRLGLARVGRGLVTLRQQIDSAIQRSPHLHDTVEASKSRQRSKETRRRISREELSSARSAAPLRLLEDAYTQTLRALHETFVAARDRGDRSWPAF